MATRLDYRTRLKNKLVALEDEGYGDFEFTDGELDTYLELAVARLYPALYKRVAQSGLTVTEYGTERLGSISPTFPDRVFLIEDATELTVVYEWTTRPTKILGIWIDDHSTVNAYYYDAYALPADDVTDAGIAAVYTPLIVLGGLVEALESRHDTGVRGDPPGNQPIGHQETQLIDRLQSRYDRLKEELAMSLPVVQV